MECMDVYNIYNYMERMQVYMTDGMNGSMIVRIMEALWLMEWMKVCMTVRINGSIMTGEINRSMYDW